LTITIWPVSRSASSRYCVVSSPVVPSPASDLTADQIADRLRGSSRYPRFAAAMAEGGQPETWDPAVHFDRLLDRILDGLVRAASE
jgi:hypothetical protein